MNPVRTPCARSDPHPHESARAIIAPEGSWISWDDGNRSRRLLPGQEVIDGRENRFA